MIIVFLFTLFLIYFKKSFAAGVSQPDFFCDIYIN